MKMERIVKTRERVKPDRSSSCNVTYARRRFNLSETNVSSLDANRPCPTQHVEIKVYFLLNRLVRDVYLEKFSQMK